MLQSPNCESGDHFPFREAVPAPTPINKIEKYDKLLETTPDLSRNV